MRILISKTNLRLTKANLVLQGNNITGIIKKFNKNFSSQSENTKCDKIDKFKDELKKQNDKIENEEDIKITDFFRFMDENIQKETEAILKNKKIEVSNNDLVDDVNELVKLVKCPITDDNLEACEEGLRISVIVFLHFKFFSPNLISYSILSIPREMGFIFYMIN